MRRRVEEACRLLDGHRQEIGDVLSVVRDREHLRLEAPPLANGAEERDVGEELHLDGLVPLAAARLAAPAARAADVKGEVRRREPAIDRRRFRREEGANAVPGVGIGGGVSARGAAEW